jgi:hypothetical protein
MLRPRWVTLMTSTPFEMISFVQDRPKSSSTVASETGPTPSISHFSPGSSDPRLSASALTCRMISARGCGLRSLPSRLPVAPSCAAAGVLPSPEEPSPARTSSHWPPPAEPPPSSAQSVPPSPGPRPSPVQPDSARRRSTALRQARTSASAMYASWPSRLPSRRASSKTCRRRRSSAFFTTPPSTGGSSPLSVTAPSSLTPILRNRLRRNRSSLACASSSVRLAAMTP